MKNNMEKYGKAKRYYCLDDFLQKPEGDLFRVSEKQKRELDKVMKATMRRNPRLNTYEGNFFTCDLYSQRLST